MEPRIAAVWAPDVPLQALLRASAELRDVPLAVLSGASVEGNAVLLAVNEPAQRAGITPGLTAAQARARCPDLALRLRAPTLEGSLADALGDVVHALSPRVDLGEAAAGWAFGDASGLEAVIGDGAAVVRAAVRLAGKLGIAVKVGVARTKSLARLVARYGGEVLAAGDEQAYVTGLPVAALEPSPELSARLTRLGLRTIGELLRLPARAVATRLGAEAARLLAWARGDEEGLRFVPTPAPLSFCERLELDWEIDNLEPLAFVLSGLLERAVSRLALRGFCAGDVSLTLGYAQGVWERRVAVAAPTREVRPLLDLCRLALAEAPPQEPVVRVAVSLAPEALRPQQLDLFVRAGPAPEKLAVLLQRLAAVCGREGVGSPRLLDTWRRDAYEVQPFSAPSGSPAVSPALPEAPRVRSLRRCRPPRPIEVVCQGTRPARLLGELSGRVTQALGPYRLSPSWWHEEPQAARDVYDVALAGGAVCRLSREGERWLLEGVYD